MRQGCTVSNTDKSNLQLLSNVCVKMNGHPVVECISIYNNFLSGHVVIHCKKHPQQYVLSSTQLSGMNLLSIQVKSNKRMQTVSHSWYTAADIQNYTLLNQKVTLGQTGILFTLRVKPRPRCLSIELKSPDQHWQVWMKSKLLFLLLPLLSSNTTVQFGVSMFFLFL